MPGLPVFSSDNTDIFVKINATFRRMPGVVTYTENASPGQTQEERGIGGQRRQTAQSAGPQTISLETRGLPRHPVYRWLRALQDGKKTGEMRVVENEDIIYPAGAGRCTIAADGTVTLTVADGIDPESDDFGGGEILRVGGKDYVIVETSAAGKFVVFDDDIDAGKDTVTAVGAATAFAILNNQKMARGDSFSFKVTAGEAWGVPASGANTNNIDIAPVSILPAWVKVA